LKHTGLFGVIDPTKQLNVDSIHVQTRRAHFNTFKGFGMNHLHITNLFGQLIYFDVGLNGNIADLSTYRQSDVFMQRNGKLFDDDETLCGDSKFIGASNFRFSSSDLLRPFTPQDIAQMNIHFQNLALEFNDSFHSLRATVELNIGGTKRSAYTGDKSKCRMSLHTHPQHVSMLYELSMYLHTCKMEWRGQFHNSNPEIVSHGIGGVNVARRVINQHLERLFTAQGRSRAFFGCALAGLNQFEPDVLV